MGDISEDRTGGMAGRWQKPNFEAAETHRKLGKRPDSFGCFVKEALRRVIGAYEAALSEFIQHHAAVFAADVLLAAIQICGM
jgi:hypothetical protein